MLIKFKIGCCSFAGIVTCHIIRGTGPLALALTIASRCRHLRRLLLDVEKTMNNRETKYLPNPRFEPDTQNRRAAQAHLLAKRINHI